MKRQSVLSSGIFLVAFLLLSVAVDQSSFYVISVCFLLSFIAYYVLCFSPTKITMRQGLLLALIARIIFIPSFPHLSDDIYRFLWDGQLALNGLSPYALTPRQLLASGLPAYLSPEQFQALNSPDYYSVYPPASQLFFALTAFLSGEHIKIFSLVLKIIFLIFECGTIFFLTKILVALKLPAHQTLFYALNPLVIVEGIGNLHFEILMIFFVVLAIYLAMHFRWLSFVFSLGISIALKMVSAILWPFLIPWLGFRRWLLASALLIVTTLLLFYPLWNLNFLNNFNESLDLYFRTFEFNASIYYAIRSVGYWIKGYNLIAWIGPLLSMISLFIVSLLALFNRQRDLQQILTIFTFAFVVYLLFSTTVHPWYVLLPLVISCMTRLKHVIIWSGLIWLSYWAYQFSPPVESQALIFIEYIGLGLALYLDKTVIRAAFSLKPVSNKKNNEVI